MLLLGHGYDIKSCVQSYHHIVFFSYFCPITSSHYILIRLLSNHIFTFYSCVQSYRHIVFLSADRVCHSCAACIGSCPGANQICNTYSRLCICAAGYKLDRTGVSCTQISAAATDVGCLTQHDCAGYPNTVCSRALGEYWQGRIYWSGRRRDVMLSFGESCAYFDCVRYTEHCE